MIRSIAVLCLFFVLSSATIIKIDQCDDVKGSITDVDVNPCDSEPCTFSPGMHVTIKGCLETDVPAPAPTMSVQVEVAGFPVEYPGLSKNACDYISCPLKTDGCNEFKIELDTLDWLPSMETDMKFHIYESEGGKELACAGAKIAIKK